MVNRKPAAARSEQEQKRHSRQKLGRLTTNKVGQQRRIRYNRAAEAFLAWLQEQGCREAESWDELDVQAVFWLEHLWAEGFPKTLAADSLSAIQHHLQSKRRLPGAWGLLATWLKLEPATQAPPLPRILLFGLCDLAIEQSLPEMVAYLLISFHCFLRPLELLQVEGSDVWLQHGNTAATLTLRQTKGSGNRGPETVTVDDAAIVFWVRQFWPHSASRRLQLSPQLLRQWFCSSLAALGATEHRFQLYSLRRGGCTHDFAAHSSVERCMVRGRWRCLATFKKYLCSPDALRLSQAYDASSELLERATRFQQDPYRLGAKNM
jgi:hypothetical protein